MVTRGGLIGAADWIDERSESARRASTASQSNVVHSIGRRYDEGPQTIAESPPNGHSHTLPKVRHRGFESTILIWRDSLASPMPVFHLVALTMSLTEVQ